MESCSACGTADAALKTCKACKLVKYCNAECQIAHRPVHKKACKKRARELFDQELFAQPPSREECDICCITLPPDLAQCTYSFCCGKMICDGCYFCLTSGRCPFCNTKSPASQEEQNKRLMERIEKYNDAVAMTQLGCYYKCGDAGFSLDNAKAVELFQRAIENGSSTAHYSLGTMYEAGVGVDIDMKKAVHHYELQL